MGFGLLCLPRVGDGVKDSMACYVIGDVQGCYAALQKLLDQLAFDPAEDELVFVGDLVNRGLGSLETLRFIKGLGERARVVLGNHDLFLLALAEGFVRAKADDTLDAVLSAPDREELLHWLRQQPLARREGDALVVHAGLLPAWSTHQAIVLSAEVESALQGPDWRSFLGALWGNKPGHWDDALQGMDRLRVIVNGMTRLRFVTADGDIDFKYKGERDGAPAGLLPWFEVPGRRSAGETILCGHWSALGLMLRPDVLALDSGCVWGGMLTALRLPDRVVFQQSGADFPDARPVDQD